MSVRLAALALVLILLAVPATAAAADGPLDPSPTAPRSYAELRAALSRHEVTSVLLVPPRSEIRATMADGQAVRLHYPTSDATLAALLLRSGAEVEVRAQVREPNAGRQLVGYMMLVLLLSVAAGLFAWRRLRRTPDGAPRRSASEGGGLRADALKGEADRPAVRFSDVAGCDEAVEEVREVLDFTRDPERFARLGARPPRGIMLYGPPGTGKTLLAKALAGEAGLAFFAVSGSEFVEKYVGTGASRVRELFAKARAHEGGAVVFIDEIDAVGRRRSSGDDGNNAEGEKTLNQLLVELDGFDTSERVVCVAATNRLDTLDEALLRPGRFGRQIHVDVPSEGGRLDILHLHGRDKPLGDDVDLKRLARITAGSSGAELAEMLNEAAIMTARAGGERIGQEELEEGHLRVLAGPRKQASMLAEGEREVVAIHEAGHVLCAELCPTHDKAQRATVQPRGKAAGLAVYGRTDRALHGRARGAREADLHPGRARRGARGRRHRVVGRRQRPPAGQRPCPPGRGGAGALRPRRSDRHPLHARARPRRRPDAGDHRRGGAPARGRRLRGRRRARARAPARAGRAGRRAGGLRGRRPPGDRDPARGGPRRAARAARARPRAARASRPDRAAPARGAPRGPSARRAPRPAAGARRLRARPHAPGGGRPGRLRPAGPRAGLSVQALQAQRAPDVGGVVRALAHAVALHGRRLPAADVDQVRDAARIPAGAAHVAYQMTPPERLKARMRELSVTRWPRVMDVAMADPDVAAQTLTCPGQARRTVQPSM